MPQLDHFARIWKSTPDHHSLLEDVQGIFTGSMIASLGLFFLNKAGLLTGGTAGAAFIVHYATGVKFGLIFFLINLPFYYLSMRRIGLDFTLKTFLAIGLTSYLTEFQQIYLRIGDINPVYAAVLGGLLLGYGLLALYRHRASLGGIGILAVYIQDSTGFRAGNVQMIFDAVILVVSFSVVSPKVVACSVLGAVILNLFITINHRMGRYAVLR